MDQRLPTHSQQNNTNPHRGDYAIERTSSVSPPATQSSSKRRKTTRLSFWDDRQARGHQRHDHRLARSASSRPGGLPLSFGVRDKSMLRLSSVALSTVCDTP